MEITNKFYLDRIRNSSNKNNWRIRRMIKEINLQISEYRLMAMGSRGYIREFCNREANLLEKNLELSIGKEMRTS